MKRFIIFLLAALLLCAGSVCAQEEELNLLTVGNIFKWTDSKQDVADLLGQFSDWTVSEGSADSDSVTIITEKAAEDKQSYCYYYFDAESELLKEVECVDIFYDDESPFAYADAVIDAYDLTSVDQYEDEFTASYAAELDGSVTVAGDETICILGGNDPTDDYYGFLTLVFLNRAFN